MAARVTRRLEDLPYFSQTRCVRCGKTWPGLDHAALDQHMHAVHDRWFQPIEEGAIIPPGISYCSVRKGTLRYLGVYVRTRTHICSVVLRPRLAFRLGRVRPHFIEG